MTEEPKVASYYERYYLDRQFNNWRTSTVHANINPKKDFLIAMVLLLGSMAIMLALAPLGKCFQSPLAAWRSTCDFESGVEVSASDKIKLSKENCDQVYDKEDWQKKPTIAYPDAKEGSIYSVFVLDPDAPDLSNGTYYLHMLQTNVRGEDIKRGNLMRSLTIAPYIGPAPPEGTGLHRYMFVIYKHCRSADLLSPIKMPSRPTFDLAKFLGSVPVKMLGPKAGVQFRAGYSK